MECSSVLDGSDPLNYSSIFFINPEAKTSNTCTLTGWCSVIRKSRRMVNAFLWVSIFIKSLRKTSTTVLCTLLCWFIWWSSRDCVSSTRRLTFILFPVWHFFTLFIRSTLDFFSLSLSRPSLSDSLCDSVCVCVAGWPNMISSWMYIADYNIYLT